MYIVPLLLGWLAFAGAQRLSQVIPDTWSETYPEILTPRISELVFRDNKEYRYIYNGQVLTGLPESANQYSGLRIRAIFTIQLRNGIDVLKIEKAVLGRINERNIVTGPLKIQPIQDFDELQGEEAREWEAALTKPIRFEYIDGTVTNLVSMESDPFWSVNIKRSILATFNLNLNKRSFPTKAGANKFLAGWNTRQAGLDNVEYFTVTEEGIGGECEATYIVQSLPTGPWGNVIPSMPGMPSANILNVTKSWDYTNCNNRPIEFQSLNNPIKCETKIDASMCTKQKLDKDMDDIINSGAHTRYNIVGTRNQYIIETATTEAVHKFIPFSEKAGSLTAYVNATMKLIYSGDWSRDSILPTEAGISLKGLRQLFPKFGKFQNDKYWMEAEEANKPFMLSAGQWPNVAAKKVLVKSLLDKLVEDLSDNEVEPESANLVLQLSLILQYATPEEVMEIHQTVKALSHQAFDHEQIQKLWMDILALSGTKPTVLFIKREIASGKLVGERAAQILNTLAFSIRKADKDIVNEVLELCKTPAVAAHSSLKKACWLTFGTLAHTSCVDDLETTTSIQNVVVKPGNPHCSSDGKRRFVTELIARMKTFQNEEEQILLIKTIGNTGFVEAIDELKAIFSDDTRTVHIRIQAIYALSHILRSQPEIVLTVLVPEFHDVTNPYQVRIAAFDIILECKPELPDLELIARSLQTEKSIQVGSYVYSKLNSMANSTHPCFEQVAKDASIALEFAKPFHTGFSFSKGFHFGGYSEQLEVGGFAEVNMISDPSSIVPRAVNFRVNTHMFGLSHDLIEAGIETEGVNSVLKRLFMTRPDALVNPVSVIDFMNEGDEETIRSDSNYRRAGFRMWERPEFDEIERILGLASRVDNDVKGSAYLKIFGQEVRFLTLTPKSIIKLVTDAYLKPTEMVGLINDALPVDFRKALMAADTEITIPTELGLPLTVELKAPVVVSAKGTLGLKTTPPLSMSTLVDIPHTLSIESDIDVSVASEIHGKMSVWSAFFKAGCGVLGKVSTVIPVDGAITFDIKTGNVQSSINIPKQPLELINLEILPVTYTKVIPKSLAPHQPDRKDRYDVDRSQKVVQFNRPPLANEMPNEFFFYKTDIMENPFMLTQFGRISSEYYKGLSLPILDYKEVATLDILKTKFIDFRIGHPALGVMINVNAHVQVPTGVPTMPMVPVGGKNRLIVTLVPFNTGLKTIKTTVFLRQQQIAPMTPPSWNFLYDQLTGYNTAGILQRLNEGLPTGFEKTDKLGVSAQVVVQGISVSGQETAMQGVFSWVRGLGGKFVKIAAEFASPHPQLSYQMCVNGHAEYPSEYDSWMLMPGMNKPMMGQFEVSFGRNCYAGEATKLRMKFVGDKSPIQLMMEKNDYYSVEGSVIPNIISKSIEPMARSIQPVFQECENDRKRGIRFSPACETVKDIYSTLMQIKIDIDYQNIPYGLEKLFTKIEHFLHSMCFWDSEVDTVRVANAPNKVTILADFTSAKDRVDIVYSTPHKNAKLLSIPAPYPLTPISADDKPMDLWELMWGEDLDDMCTVSGDELNTLDNARFKIPLSECYHLLAKDCSMERAWAVMYAAAGSRFGEAKKVLAYIGSKKIELIPADTVSSRFQSATDMVILIDGRPVPVGPLANSQFMVENGIYISIEAQESSLTPYYKISAQPYGVELWFDGHNVAVKPTFWLRNQICGLCGNNNGESWDDMTLPTGKFAESIPEFLRGYMMQKGGCGAELKPVMSMRTQSLFPTSFASECGKQKTIIKTRPGLVCFSIEPVTNCPGGCNSEEDEDDDDYIMVKRAPFHCIPEDSSLAQSLLAEAQTRVLTEMSQKPVNDYFVVPKVESCGSAAGRSKNSIKSSKLSWGKHIWA
ncbi:vitellogenin-6-like [Paramacrobiotus metropolitanus]|uniref:vitellogenin-6-like n=1 Tax=Paramacrobiotus metropolitanus TaxID=2943436 RepID=UPI00244629F8|nr:vitellogenin-6-like [Paramacrobiotus metropolitanus]